MFLVPFILLGALLLAISLPCWIIRRERRLVPLFLVLSMAVGVVIWLFWTRELSYTVSSGVNGQLTSSYEEPFRTEFKLVLTAVLALILGASAALLAGRLQQLRRRRTNIVKVALAVLGCALSTACGVDGERPERIAVPVPVERFYELANDGEATERACADAGGESVGVDSVDWAVDGSGRPASASPYLFRRERDVRRGLALIRKLEDDSRLLAVTFITPRVDKLGRTSLRVAICAWPD